MENVIWIKFFALLVCIGLAFWVTKKFIPKLGTFSVPLFPGLVFIFFGVAEWIRNYQWEWSVWTITGLILALILMIAISGAMAFVNALGESLKSSRPEN